MPFCAMFGLLLVSAKEKPHLGDVSQGFKGLPEAKSCSVAYAG